MFVEESKIWIIIRYRYDVTYSALVDGWALSAVVSMARMF